MAGNGIATVSGKTVYPTPTGIKISARGKVLPPLEAIQQFPAGERRRIRRALAEQGRNDLVQQSLPPKLKAA
jgi:hypothetical protein